MELLTSERMKTTLKYIRSLFFIGLILAICALLFLFIILTYAKLKGAPPTTVSQASIFYAEDGSYLGEIHSGEKRYWVPIKDISPYVLDATVATEDRKFYHHHGFDGPRIVAAALADLKAMAKVQGASTITQQYARNLFLNHDKTWKRKWAEALYTLRLEINYSKKQILEGYLNTIYYGHGVYGIEAAAKYYFHKSAKDLSLSEASFLAGIPKNPTRFSPYHRFDEAKQRQELVLQFMVNNGYISMKEKQKAEQEKLQIVNQHERTKMVFAPYFQDAVKQQLYHHLHLDPRLIDTGGLKVYTTLRPEMQRIAETQIHNLIPSSTELEAALVAIEPKTGEVQALVGGRNYEKSAFNRATQAERQPGSTFKPFLFYAALKNGYTPSTTTRSELTTFTLADGKESYTPHNYNNYYANDEITLAQAIALSDNVYAVKTHLFLGEQELVHTAKKLGITSHLATVPSLALGTSNVKVIDMAKAYSVFGNGGKRVEPVFIKKIVGANGEVIYEAKKPEKQILNKDLTFVTNHLLTGMFDEKLNDYTSVTGRTIIHQLTRPYAGKSGTTQTDSWMIGYTPQLVTAIWTGYDKGKTMDQPGEKQYAKRIWANFMEQSLKGEPVVAFKPTKGVVGVYTDPKTGFLATEDCPNARFTYYKKGTEPQEYCIEHFTEKEKRKEKNKKKKAEEQEENWWKRFVDWLP